MSGNSDVFDATSLLEEILVRVPYESIFNCILVSKRWFDLICGPCFREHYIRRWSDEVKLMQSAEVYEHYIVRFRDAMELMQSAEVSVHSLRRWIDDVNLLQFEPSAEAGELQQQLQSPQLAALNQLQHRLQSQQLAALDQLQHRLTVNQLQHPSLGSTNESLHRLHSERVAAFNKLHPLLELVAEDLSETVIDNNILDVVKEHKKLRHANTSQRECESELLAEVRESLKQLPSQRWAAVNEVQHQIVCQLLVVVNDAQCRQYYDLITKPLARSLRNMQQQLSLVLHQQQQQLMVQP